MFIDAVLAAHSQLQGKVAIVTGAGRGIGRQAARVLARLGACVVIAEVSETGRMVEQEIRTDGGDAMFIQTNVADEQSVTALHDRVMETYGQVDVVVNNATVFTCGPLWEVSVADWDRVTSVNLRGAFLMVRTFLPHMLERKEGTILMMESAEGMPYLAPYLATKVGLRSLALSLAQEVGEESGVSVFCFGPGMVETPGILEALEHLAPLYQMSRDQFIRHSGGTMIDAEICATGLAGTILHAREFHGQQTGFSAGLARLGLSVAGDLWSQQPNAAIHAEEPTRPAEPTAPMAAALAANRELEQMLHDNIREYDELTIFQRPIVRRMFQSATGLKVEEWLKEAQAMSAQLERHDPGHPDAYIAKLNRLADYIKKQETDARGFFRNQADLDRALVALAARRDICLRLARHLTEATSAATGR